MDRQSLEQGIVRYGTPSYFFDMDLLKENFQTFREILGARAGLCFAMKANPFLAEQMAEMADRLEVCSPGEFKICRELQITPEKLFLSGVLKKREEVYEMLEYTKGRSAFTVESPQQFQYLVDWCEESRQTVPVYLRLSSGNQFGMDWQTLLSIVELRKGCPYVQIKGIHFFSGTQKKGTAKIREEIAYLDRRCRELEEEYGFSVETLEYGPGLSVAYFQGEEDRLLVDLQETAEALETMEWRGNVILEMGRALTACCGYYLTRICEVKQSDGKNYCMTDGGIHQLHYDGQIRGMYLPKIQMIPGSQEADEQEWTVCGALCTVNDLLLCRVRLAGPAIGKTLVFEQTGAYSATEGMALFLSRELPAVALYSRDMGWKQIRRRQPTYPWTMKKEDAEWKHC